MAEMHLLPAKQHSAEAFTGRVSENLSLCGTGITIHTRLMATLSARCTLAQSGQEGQACLNTTKRLLSIHKSRGGCDLVSSRIRAITTKAFAHSFFMASLRTTRDRNRANSFPMVDGRCFPSTRTTRKRRILKLNASRSFACYSNTANSEQRRHWTTMSGIFRGESLCI